MKARVYPLLVFLIFVTASSIQAEETLTWQQCVSEARQAHPNLYSALAVLQQAEADKRITGGGLLPQISLGLSSQNSRNTAGGSGSGELYSYLLSAQQLLYDGHKTSHVVRSKEESIKAAQYNYSAVSSDVRFVLRSAFTELLKAQDLVGLANEIALRRRKNVRLINLRYEGGREHIGALRQAEADLAQAEFEVSQSKRGLRLAQVKLASGLGRDQHKKLRVQGDFRSTDVNVGQPDIEGLARNNPLFQQLDAQSKAARFDLDASRSAFVPQLYLNTSAGKSAFDRLPVNTVDWNAGVTVSVPIYEGGSGRVKVSKAMAVVNQYDAAQKNGYLQIFDFLEESWKSFQDARQMVTVQKKFLDAAVERSSIASAQYSNGLITFNDWVIIENNLVNAKKGFLNAEAALLIAEAQWIHAKGVGLDGQQE